MSWLQFVEILIIAIFSFLAYQLCVRLVRYLASKKYLSQHVVPFFAGILKWIVILLALVFVLSVFNIGISQLITILSGITVMIAIAFVALWSALSNMLCAIILLIFQPFRFGDEIELKEPDKEKGARGKVVNLNLFFTTLESTAEDESADVLINIPNVLFFQRIINCYKSTDSEELSLGGLQEGKDNTTVH